MSDSSPDDLQKKDGEASAPAARARGVLWERWRRRVVGLCLAGGLFAPGLLAYGFANGRFGIVDTYGDGHVALFMLLVAGAAVCVGRFLAGALIDRTRWGVRGAWGVAAASALLALVVLWGFVFPPPQRATVGERDEWISRDFPLGNAAKKAMQVWCPDPEGPVFPLQFVPLLRRYILLSFIYRPDDEYLGIVRRLTSFKATLNDPEKMLADIRQGRSGREVGPYLARCGASAEPAILKEFLATYSRKDSDEYNEVYYFGVLGDVLTAYPSPERDQAFLTALRDYATQAPDKGWAFDPWVPLAMAALADNNCREAVPVLGQVYERSEKPGYRREARIALNRLGHPLAAEDTSVTLPVAPPAGCTQDQMNDLHDVLAALSDHGVWTYPARRVVTVERVPHGGLKATCTTPWKLKLEDGTVKDLERTWTFQTVPGGGHRVWVYWTYWVGAWGNGVSLLEKRNGQWLLLRNRQIGVE